MENHQVSEASRMTAAQIDWARKHDWFVRVGIDGSVIVREDEFAQVDGKMVLASSRHLRFTNFHDLRDWAGY